MTHYERLFWTLMEIKGPDANPFEIKDWMDRKVQLLIDEWRASPRSAKIVFVNLLSKDEKVARVMLANAKNEIYEEEINL